MCLFLNIFSYQQSRAKKQQRKWSLVSIFPLDLVQTQNDYSSKIFHPLTHCLHYLKLKPSLPDTQTGFQGKTFIPNSQVLTITHEASCSLSVFSAMFSAHTSPLCLPWFCVYQRKTNLMILSDQLKAYVRGQVMALKAYLWGQKGFKHIIEL